MQSLVQPEDPAGGWQGLVVAQTAIAQSDPAGHGANSCLVSYDGSHTCQCGTQGQASSASKLQSISAEPYVPARDAVHACRLTSMQLLRNGPSGCPADAAGDDSDGSEGFLETLQREVTQERVPAGGNAEESKSEKEDLTCRWGLVGAHECSCCAPAFLQRPVKN